MTQRNDGQSNANLIDADGAPLLEEYRILISRDEIDAYLRDFYDRAIFLAASSAQHL